jgi:hypothetical protein
MALDGSQEASSMEDLDPVYASDVRYAHTHARAAVYVISICRRWSSTDDLQLSMSWGKLHFLDSSCLRYAHRSYRPRADGM